ncbi:alpha/beta hydrolase [Phenylobacterium sp. LjRoot225]|uniref:alpha/beta hydrolase n=1 Tax=Phenylobacterium sp. LjRoot225 TaxID=3342285 RepID=UPI003ECE73DD
MTLETLTRRDVQTRLGVVPLWSRPEVFASAKPLVLAITGAFAGPDDLSRLPEVMSPMAEAAVLHIPGIGAPLLSDPSIEGFSSAVGELIDQLFADRRVVVLGVSIGAVAALGVRARSVRRIVAVEPLLATAALWPMADSLRAHLAGLPADSPIHPLFAQLFGVSREAIAPRLYHQVLDGLAVPVDVVLASEPLHPRRPVARMPSLVDAPERALLASLPRVRMHLARGAGHNVQGQASKTLKELLFEACRRASADPAYDPRGLDEALVEAVPLTAARVVHWGPGGRAFAGGYLSWNPTAQVNVLGEDPAAALDPAEAGGLDAVVLGAPPPPGLLAGLVAALRPGGDLVARWAGEDGRAAWPAPASRSARRWTPRGPGWSARARSRRGPAGRRGPRRCSSRWWLSPAI